MVVLKQAFGLVAIIVGAGLLLAGLGQSWMAPKRPFQTGPLIAGIVLGFLFIRFGYKWLFNLIPLGVLPVDPGNPHIAEATRLARASLPRLWDYLAQNQHDCYIKFPLETAGGEIEHIWGVVHSRSNGGVVVSLANQPMEQPREESQRRVVSTNDIEDWQVVISESEIRGGYSVGALHQIATSQGYRLSRADKKRLRVFVDVWGETRRP